MSVRILQGDCRSVLKTLPDESVHMCVTSPPYFNLRDYGTAQWECGDPRCDHVAFQKPPVVGSSSTLGYPADGGQRRIAEGNTYHEAYKEQYRSECGKCGARRIDSQIGLEPTPAAYVAELVSVFREVRRVLRRDGTLWLNLGDSYAGNWNPTRTRAGGFGGPQGLSVTAGETAQFRPGNPEKNGGNNNRDGLGFIPGLKPKDLIGIPWMVAFALRNDGWWLRQDIIWSKPNPMPESCTDRCTKAHEYIFLLTKSARYYYDAEAIQEEGSGKTPGNVNYKYDGLPGHETKHGILKQSNIPQLTRNKRSVWTVATQPFPGSHFAVFPPALIEPCILAGCPAKCCAKCGAPWNREVSERPYPKELANAAKAHGGIGNNLGGQRHQNWLSENPRRTLGFSPSCTCNTATVLGTVLDPFFGAGTTGLVADRLQRNCIGIELNPDYVAMSRKRCDGDAPLFAEAAE